MTFPVPSQDTSGRVLSLIGAGQIERCHRNLVMSAGQFMQGEVVAMDGKMLRGSCDTDTGKESIEPGQRMGRRQLPGAGAGRGWRLLMRGAAVTIDAMGCQRDMIGKTVEAGTVCVQAVRKDQKTLSERMRDMSDMDHGRGEIRRRRAVTSPECLKYVDPKYRRPGIKVQLKVKSDR